ncbi:MAG: type II 3-dehydroquinate dehydratase, partial [Chloroflexota bacterium]
MEIKLLLLNGPNLNMLGTREPEIYGNETLPMLVDALKVYAAGKSIELRDYQSNVEGELVTAIQEARNWADGILINPGA